MSVMTFSRKAAVLLLAVLTLLAISGVGVRAENERNVIYDGEAKKIVSLPDDDLFFNYKELVPGEVQEQRIWLNNKDFNNVKMYLHAEAAEAEGFDTPEEKALSDELLKRLRLHLDLTTADGNVRTIYNGPASGLPETSGQGTLKDDIFIGEYTKNDQGIIDATLTVPGDLENKYQEALGRVHWVFICDVAQSGSKTEGSGGAPSTGLFGQLDSMGAAYLLVLLALLSVSGVMVKRKKR